MVLSALLVVLLAISARVSFVLREIIAKKSPFSHQCCRPIIHQAFVPPSSADRGVTGLFMAPKFDKSTNRWIPGPRDGPEAGYGVGKTLLLRGPKPFLHRLFQPDDYEQAVLKFMSSEGCSRTEAQGNMDAYLEVRR
jgi:hypothetical protein